jgi:hypothetical protein
MKLLDIPLGLIINFGEMIPIAGGLNDFAQEDQ